MGKTNRGSPAAITLLMLAAGLIVLLYPTLSNYLAQREQTAVIEKYEQQLKTEEKASLEEEWNLARSFNEGMADIGPNDPFVYEDEGDGTVPAAYWRVLNLNGDGVMGYLSIPKISVRLPIMHGTGEEALKRGAGHIMQTSLPIGGDGTHCILTGHRGLPNAKLFTRLDELAEGDRIYISVLDETLAYEVDGIVVLLPDELEDYYELDEREDIVTLLTCTPYGENTHRLLVRCRRTAYEEELPSDQTTIRLVYDGVDERLFWLCLVLGGGALISASASVVVAVVKRNRKKREPSDQGTQ